MADGVIQSAIQNLEHKYIPQASAPSIFVPSEAYRQLYELLEVWGKDTENQDVQDKTKYVYNKLLEGGNPKQALLDIITTLGVISTNDTKVDRVWKYLHLQENAEKAKKHYDILLGEIDSLKGKTDGGRK